MARKLGYLWLVVIACCGTGIAYAKASPPRNRISMHKARKLAEKAFPGRIEEGELEFEHGRWIYSFDMKRGSDNVTHEVHIDPVSGKLLSLHTESAAAERREAKSEGSESRHNKD